MWAWLKPLLGIADKLLGLLRSWQAERQRKKDREQGKFEVAAEEAEKLEEARRERQEIDRDVAALPDRELDERLDRWMRD